MRYHYIALYFHKKSGEERTPLKDRKAKFVIAERKRKTKKWVKCTIYIGENGYNTHLVKQGIICYNVCWWDTPPMIYEEIH